MINDVGITVEEILKINERLQGPLAASPASSALVLSDLIGRRFSVGGIQYSQPVNQKIRK